jgi:hypothetical protein
MEIQCNHTHINAGGVMGTDHNGGRDANPNGLVGYDSQVDRKGTYVDSSD